MSGSNTPNYEVRQFRNAAQIASIYHGDKNFERKSNISEIVHGSFHLYQVIVAATLIVFHRVHYAANHFEQYNPNPVPNLPAENKVFIVFPICMVLSLTLAILRFCTRILVRRPGTSMIISFVGAILMITGGISAMRRVELNINIAEVPDEELLVHPIFIHNYVICLVSIFGCTMHLIQSWILYDVWQSERRERRIVNSVDAIESGASQFSFKSTPTVSRQSNNERRRCIKVKDRKNKKQKYNMQEQPGILHPVVTLDKLPTFPKGSPMEVQSVIYDPETEPLNIYCCCVDLYRYTNMKYFTKKPTHEFQVVHVM